MAVHRILILFAHPALEKSRIHRRLLERSRSIYGVTVNDLYEEYPDFDVDVKREQELLLAHDLIVVQHPIYWYSSPALVKQWEDLVLEHGWAYGTGGTALHGKRMLAAVSTGGRAAAYQMGGLNRFSIRDYLRPLEQTALLCGMRWTTPYVIHGAHLMTPAEIEGHVERWGETLEAIRDGRMDLDAEEPWPTPAPGRSAASA